MHRCVFCGIESGGILFLDWVKPTFTDHDKLQNGDMVCSNCLFWFDERSERLARLVGKEKPQRMRNYSHFIIADEWIPLSKGHKERMKQLLLNGPFPELVAIAESGQKHIVFRARRNDPGGHAGWIQFEEQSFFVVPDKLKQLLDVIEQLYVEFSKTEIRTGNYKGHRVVKFGLECWQALESKLRPKRSSLLFRLAVFLAQKGENHEQNGIQAASRELIDGSMARSAEGIQKSIPPHDLDTVREQCSVSSLHQQSGQVRQLALFEDVG